MELLHKETFIFFNFVVMPETKVFKKSVGFFCLVVFVFPKKLDNFIQLKNILHRILSYRMVSYLSGVSTVPLSLVSSTNLLRMCLILLSLSLMQTLSSIQNRSLRLLSGL